MFRKHIIETLPYIQSNSAVALMKDLIIKKKVTNDVINSWVTAFAMIPRPDRQTVKAVAPLLDFQHEIPEAQFILSYSAMIHSFCINTPNYDCSNLEDISAFLSYLETNIEKGCSRRYHEFEDIKAVSLFNLVIFNKS